MADLLTYPKTSELRPLLFGNMIRFEPRPKGGFVLRVSFSFFFSKSVDR